MTNFDLKTLGLADGTHEITVVAKASGYKDSPPSNAVNYVVGSEQPETYTISASAYTFKETISYYESFESIEFNSNGRSYTEMGDLTGDWRLQYGDTRAYNNAYNFTDIDTGAGTWYNNAYRTVNIPLAQTVSREFYNWFTANAVKQN